MTQIILVTLEGGFGCSWIEDPRPPRELIMLINTGMLRLGETFFSTLDAQSCCSIPELDVVLVTDEAPHVNLTPRLYQVLWLLADGLAAHHIAAHLHIQPKTVYHNYNRLKERFGAATLAEVLAAASNLGYL